MDFMTSALILTWVAIALLGLVVSGLVRQVHQLSRGATSPVRAPAELGIRPGAAAPGADELFGEEPHSGGVLLFLSADCRTCADVLTEARRRATDGARSPALRALYAGPAPQQAGPGPEADDGVPVHGDRADLFALHDAIATPFAVAVDAESRVLRSVPLGSAASLLELLDDVFPRQPRSTL